MEWSSGYSDEEKAALQHWLEENRPSLDTLRKASQMTCYWPVHDTTPGALTHPVVIAGSLKPFEGYRRLVFTMREQIAWEVGQDVRNSYDCPRGDPTICGGPWFLSPDSRTTGREGIHEGPARRSVRTRAAHVQEDG